MSEPLDEAPLEETPPSEEGTDDATPAEPERVYAGKYKSPEELERAYEEMQSLQGRQSSELGELRQFRDQLLQQQYTVPPDQLYAYADEDPQQATQAALKQYGADSIPYEQTLRQWAAEDPIGASRFDQAVRLSQFEHRIQPQLERVGLSNALDTLMRKYPDVAEYGEAIMREAQASPVVARLAQAGQPIDADVLETLYLTARGRQGLAQTVARTEDANAAREQKLGAGVASATAARPEEPGGQSPEDAFTEEYLRVARRMGLNPSES